MNKIQCNSRIPLLLVVILAAVMFSCVQGGKSPERVSAKKCLDCHEEMNEKFSHGYVHTPVQNKKCEQCHLPHGLVGGVFLRHPQPKLCYSCHEDLAPSDGDRSIHKPVEQGQCDQCHLPHNSKYPQLLNEPSDKGCFRCHEEGKFSGKYVHSPVEDGCESCHDPHKSENKRLLKVEPDKQCANCHEVDREKFKENHRGFPVKSGCLKCHTPHASDKPNYLKKNLHKPIQEGECTSCHRVEKNEIKIKDEANALCFNCHDKATDHSGSSHEPYLGKKCVDCHTIHASDERFLLTKPEEDLCYQCHDAGKIQNKYEQYSGKSKVESIQSSPQMVSYHEPVVSGKCLECHGGHGSSNKKLLKKEENELCISCHDGSLFEKLPQNHIITEGKSCNTCHEPHYSMNKNLLTAPQENLCFSCHREEYDERGRLSLHQPFSTANCTGCHKLHGAPQTKLLKNSLENGELCINCHESEKEPSGRIHNHEPVLEGRCTSCHASHSADYPYMIKTKPGKLCLSCHEDIEKVVRNSSVVHEPALMQECSSCHAAHGSSHDHILKKGQPVVCLNCHNDIAQYWRKGVIHEPAVKNCLTCHSAHGGEEQGMLINKSGLLCGECHNIKSVEFIAAHNDITPGTDSCKSCHDAHGSPEKGLLFPYGHKPFEEGNCSPCHKGRSN